MEEPGLEASVVVMKNRRGRGMKKKTASSFNIWT